MHTHIHTHTHQVLYSRFLSRFVLATPSELEQVRLITDDRVHAARKVLLNSEKKDYEAPRGEPMKLVNDLIGAGVCVGTEEGLIRAVHAALLSMSDKTRVVKVEDLTKSLKVSF